MPRMMTMKLQCKVGPYAGMILEYPVHVAEALLSSGQAEHPPESVKGPAAEVANAPRPEVPEWSLKTPPEEYLKRNPGGKNAALARRIVGEAG